MTAVLSLSGDLIRYEAACRALAEARSVDEVKNIRDVARQMRAAARIAKNRELEADAFDIRVRAERRLGEMMAAAKSAGDIASGPGRPRKNGSATEPFPATLTEINIDKKLSARAQRLNAIPPADFEAMVAEGREEIQRSAEKRVIKAAEIAEARANYNARAEVGGKVDDLNALAESGKRFAVILADPAWTYTFGGRGAVRNHYDCLSLDDIKALPVNALAADDAVLFLWATWPIMPSPFAVIDAWGFEFKTLGFDWVKMNPSGNGLHTGNGYWTRSNAEPCLLATRGNPMRLDMGVHQIIMAPVAEHSRKPDEAAARIERLLAGPYLELFGRRPREGWTVWGNEIAALPSEPGSPCPEDLASVIEQLPRVAADVDAAEQAPQFHVGGVGKAGGHHG
jgi:N6-adenosine-specific RNA methylase IME4